MQDGFVPLLYVLGNHEVWSEHGAIPKKWLFGATGRFERYVQKNYNPTDENKMYYYVDNAISKIRCYFLDSSSAHGNYGFSTTQISWVESTLATLPNGYSIVIFTHIPFTTSAMHSTEKETLIPIGLPGNSDLLRQVLKAKVDNGTNLLAIINGHMHWDLIAYDSELNCPCICTLSEKFENIETAEKWKIANQIPYDWQRAENNITEYAIDVYSVPTDEEVITVLRFGAGKSRKVHTTPVEVETSATLVSSLESPTWTTYSSEIATVTNGVVTRVSAGNTVVVAQNDTDAEFWYITD